MRFKYAYGIAPGGSNGDQETKYRDKVRSTENNGVAVFSLADFFAERLAESAVSLITERFDELYASEGDFVQSVILEAGTEFSRIDCTMQFIAVKENRYLAGHLGSGLIAQYHEGCSILSMPGEDMTKLRIYRGILQEPYGFMLLSGGACQSLYENAGGNLSPACGTFFEWLKEYDEETVSEALAENINKYFFKNTIGDISVAVMFSDEDITAIAEEAEETAKENGKNKNLLKYIIAIAVVLAVIFVCTLIPRDGAEPKGAAEKDSNPPITKPESYEPTVTFSVDNPESFNAGEYQVGEDIPAGEYFFWTGEMLKPDSVKVNDFTCLSDELYCLIVRVNNGDTLSSDIRFTAAENVNPVEAANGVLISGKYRIGKDLAPGTYTVKPEEEGTAGRYYSIHDDEISNDTEVSEATTVTVPEEGYVVFYHSVLVVEEN